MELLFSKTVGGQHVMCFTVSVHVCLIVNHGTIFHKLYRVPRVTIDSVSDCVGFAHGPWNHF